MTETTTIESGSGGQPRLRCAFPLAGGRIATCVCLQDVTGIELLRSREPSEPLAGPVFQEVYRQSTPDRGAVAYLTGMADGRYWSASVEAAGSDAPRLTFDCACRLKGQPGGVAAEWELADGVDAALNEGELRLSVTSQPVAVLRPVPIEGHPAAQLMLSERIVMLAPGEGFAGDPRWAFEIVGA